MTTMTKAERGRLPAFAPLTDQDTAWTRVLPMSALDPEIAAARVMDACARLTAAGFRILSAHSGRVPTVTVAPPACDGARGAMRRRTGMVEERCSLIGGVLVSWRVPRLGRPRGAA